MIEKNVVILRIETGNPSGVVRYIQMLTEGMKHMNGIKVHIICLNTSLIFPKFEVTEDRIIANIPYPSKSKPLRNEIYWLTKYFNVVSDLISPYFKNRKQLIWHVQELLLVKLADILKLSPGCKGMGFSFSRMLCGPSCTLRKCPTPWPVPCR